MAAQPPSSRVKEELILLLFFLGQRVAGGTAERMARFLVEFSDRFLEKGPGRYLLMSLENVEWADAGLRAMHRHWTYPVTLFTPSTDLDLLFSRSRPAGGCIIVGQRAYVEEVVRHLQSLRLWNSNTRVLVLLREQSDGEEDPHDSVQGLLSYFWSQSASNVVVAFDGENDTLPVYGMSPFKETRGLCGQEDVGVTLMGTIHTQDQPQAMQDLPLYQDVVPRDLGGCIVRASLSNGIPPRCIPDGVPLYAVVLRKIFLTAARFHNFRPRVVLKEIPYDSREIYPNGTFTNRLNLLEPGETDVVLAPLTYTMERLRRLRPSVPFLVDPAQVRIRCPSLRPEPAVLHLTMSLARSHLLHMLTLAALIIIVARVLLQKRRSSKKKPQSTLQVVLQVWSTLCEVSVPELPTTVHVRIIISSWFLFVLNFNVGLKGLLSADSTAVAVVQEITSMDQLRKTDIVLGYPTRTYTEVLREEFKFPPERMLLCVDNTSYYCEDRFDTDEKFAVLETLDMPVSMTCLSSCYYIMDAAVRHNSFLLYMRRHYPLGSLFDQVILRLQQAGLIRHWLARSPRDEGRQNESKPDFVSEALIYWGVGLTLALTVFLLEMKDGSAVQCPKKIKSRLRRNKLVSPNDGRKPSSNDLVLELPALKK